MYTFSSTCKRASRASSALVPALYVTSPASLGGNLSGGLASFIRPMSVTLTPRKMVTQEKPSITVCGKAPSARVLGSAAPRKKACTRTALVPQRNRSRCKDTLRRTIPKNDNSSKPVVSSVSTWWVQSVWDVQRHRQAARMQLTTSSLSSTKGANLT